MAVLDTTVLIDLMRGDGSPNRNRAIAKLLEVTDRGELLRTTIFNVSKLLVGVHKGDRPMEERQSIEECLGNLEVLPFSGLAAKIFGMIVGDLERRGETISDMDGLIAAVALKHNDLIITRNVRHFSRIRGLVVEAY